MGEWVSGRTLGRRWSDAQGGRLVYVGRVEWGATRAVVARIREHCKMLSGPSANAPRGGTASCGFIPMSWPK